MRCQAMLDHDDPLTHEDGRSCKNEATVVTLQNDECEFNYFTCAVHGFGLFGVQVPVEHEPGKLRKVWKDEPG